VIAAISAPPRLGAEEPKIGKVVLESKGYLVPASQVTVSPKVAGQVAEMRIEEGKQVKEGEVLARLDTADYEAAHQLARAELSLAEAELSKSRGGGSRADVAIAQAKVRMAQAHLASAQYRLDGTDIRAPVSGTVLVKRAEVGTRIDPNAFQVPASLCDLADLRSLDVEVWVQEIDLAKVFRGQACLIRAPAVPGATYKGHVARLLPVADRAKGAVGLRVRVEVPPGDDRLRPELGVLVQFAAKP
jgi:RND family efflux transporter MFP subunit